MYVFGGYRPTLSVFHLSLETGTPTGLGIIQALSLLQEYTTILGFLHGVLVALSVAGDQMQQTWQKQLRERANSSYERVTKMAGA